MWYLIVSIPDLCTLTYLHYVSFKLTKMVFVSEKMYRFHVLIMQTQGQCHNFMSSLEGNSFNYGNILTLIKQNAPTVHGTSHGSDDFSSRQQRRRLDALVFHVLSNRTSVMI